MLCLYGVLLCFDCVLCCFIVLYGVSVVVFVVVIVFDCVVWCSIVFYCVLPVHSVNSFPQIGDGGGGLWPMAV